MIWLLLGFVVLLPAAGAIWQALAERRDLSRFPPPGAILPSGLHVSCAGLGRPVLLQAGIAASSVGWIPVQRRLAPYCRVCATDRPGFGWSDASKLPRTAEQYLREMHEIVQFAGTPAVLTGHSFGGLLVQLYAEAHPENVAGLVLVDPPHVSEWANPRPADLERLRRGVSLSRRGAWLVRIGFVRLALVMLTRGAHGASKAFASASSGRARAYLEGLVGQVRKLPPELWPVVQAHWCRAASFLSMADHLESLPAIASAVASCTVPPEIPVTVISGAHLRADLVAEHAAVAKRSYRGEHLVAQGSGHWVHLDAPDLVAEAVRKMLLSE